ncbi:hypothetical protein D3C81_1126720 [compost metagenome]
MYFAVFCVTAAGNQGANRVADGVILYPNTDSDYGTGDLQTRNIRCASRRCVLAAALHHIRAVNAGGSNLHQNFSLLQGWQRSLAANQNLWFARLADFDDFHGVGQRWVG